MHDSINDGVMMGLWCQFRNWLYLDGDSWQTKLFTHLIGVSKRDREKKGTKKTMSMIIAHPSSTSLCKKESSFEVTWAKYGLTYVQTREED